MVTFQESTGNSGQATHDADVSFADDFVPPTPTDQRATLNCKELFRGLNRRFRDIEAMEVEYSFRQASLVESSDPLRREVRTGRRHYAFKGKRWFVNETSDAPNPFANCVHFCDGHNHWKYRPLDRIAENHPFKRGRGESDIYLSMLAQYEPSRTLNRNQDGINNLCWTLVSQSSIFQRLAGYQVGDQLQDVDGHSCHVIETARGRRERSWIDSNCGFAVRLHEILMKIPGANRSDWPVLMRTTYQDIRQVDNQRWFPWKTRLRQYLVYKKSAHYGECAVDWIVNIDSVRLNENVRGDLFKVQFPPRTLVHDYVERRHYRVDDHGNRVDEIIL